MPQHPNAMLTPMGRETLVSRIESSLGVAEAARQMGVSARRRASDCAAAGPESSCPTATAVRAGSRGRRRARSRSGSRPPGGSSWSLRSGSPPRRACPPGPAPGSRRGAGCPGSPTSTGSPARFGAAARSPPCATSSRGPGLVHVDVKKVARIPDGGGWRARGESVLARPDSGAGYACLHVAVDDRSRVAYTELLSDEKKDTCATFMGRALRFYAGLSLPVERVMATRPGISQRRAQRAAGGRGARHVYTRPYSPW